jgi:tRNA threonylcarbamoyl adenosine modification protein YjeE
MIQSMIENKKVNQEALENEAVSLAQLFESQKISPWNTPILLFGDLGAGKSTFARAFIQALTTNDTVVPSPTFTIVQTYEAKNANTIAHFDLYRIADIDELIDIGYFEYIEDALCLIEWPERLENQLPFPHLRLEIELIDNHYRLLSLLFITDSKSE